MVRLFVFLHKCLKSDGFYRFLAVFDVITAVLPDRCSIGFLSISKIGTIRISPFCAFDVTRHISVALCFLHSAFFRSASLIRMINCIESMQIDLAENASAFDRPFEAQQFYIFNSSVIAIARIYVNIIRRLCISQ